MKETTRGKVEIPETLPLLPIRDLVIFPYMIVPLMVSREISAQAVAAALGTRDRLVLLVSQKHETDDDPGPDAVHGLGTVGMIMKMRKLSDGRVKVVVQGLVRARIGKTIETAPCVRVAVERIPETEERHVSTDKAAHEALVRAVRDDFEKYAQSGKVTSPEVLVVASGIEDPGRLADLVAANLPLKVEVGQAILERIDPIERLREVGQLLRNEVEILAVQATIQSRAKEEMSKTQREYFLREQLRQIQSELGGGESRGELDQLRERIASAGMSDEAQGETKRQLRRLEQMNADSAEAGVIRTYLEWLVDLPWKTVTTDTLDLKAAAKILDEDHYGLDDVKNRILEYLGVLRLVREREGGKGEGAGRYRGPILCLVGPPGVGKTSLGRSIARALGRKFVRVSLGGVRDEAEIRGHRRTYVGAMPGRIAQGMKQAETLNPVFVLDEIDKLGADFRGDPSAALLEVLDPEQNGTFRDHYVGVAYDLSRALFIATANATDPIPKALYDRMEVIRLAGYTEDEKVAIAERHVLPRQREAAGLDDETVKVSEPALRVIISDYTREAGLRDLERRVAQISRKVARGIVEDRDAGRKVRRVNVTPASLRDYLGAPMHARLGTPATHDEVGAATGLAWTPYGGEMLVVEAQWMPGRGSLILTGQLGDVMKESAMTALSFARARASELGLKEGFYGEREIHIHVPAGAVQKDGPSAGVTMASALVSLMTGQAVRRDVAMTGEITLRGHVLPVGGVKEKLLAAARAGAKIVLLPEGNAGDLEDLPRTLLRNLEIVLCGRMDDVLRAALVPATRPRERAAGEQSTELAADASRT